MGGARVALAQAVSDCCGQVLGEEVAGTQVVVGVVDVVVTDRDV